MRGFRAGLGFRYQSPEMMWTAVHFFLLLIINKSGKKYNSRLKSKGVMNLNETARRQ